MEARLSLEGTESNLKHHRTDVTSDDQRKPRIAQSTPVKKVSTTNNPTKPAAMTAANKAKQAAERLAAWQRRKNYDPLKAATNGKVQQVCHCLSQSTLCLNNCLRF